MKIANRPILALIPARGGSKGVARKNMRLIAGKPLLEYTLSAALNSEFIDEVYLSSDDAEMLRLGSRLGAKAIERPNEFATDAASAIDVVRHFITVLSDNLCSQNPQIIYLQPTSPLRNAEHIDAAIKLLSEKNAHTLVSVTELSKSPYKSFQISSSGQLQSLFDERLSNARRQDLPKAYLPNGAIYIFQISDFLEREGFPSNGSIPYLMTEEESLDIDSEQDIECLEKILGVNNG